MCFSLFMFFEELNAILSDEILSDEVKLEKLKTTVETNREYASVCNQL